MKTLVVFYSRTENTKVVGEAIARRLGTDSEEIVDLKNRRGIWGFISGGFAATLERLTKIKTVCHDPASYDLLIVGTPVWASNMAPAVRTYLQQHRAQIKAVAAFCTFGGSGEMKTKEKMETLMGRKIKAFVAIRASDIAQRKFDEAVTEFAQKLS